MNEDTHSEYMNVCVAILLDVLSTQFGECGNARIHWTINYSSTLAYAVTGGGQTSWLSVVVTRIGVGVEKGAKSR